MIDREELRRQWEAERPLYDRLSKLVKMQIQRESQQRGIYCTVTSRVKETDSFIKKAVRKSYSDPYYDIRDKAGVRVVCTYRDSLPQIEGLTNDLFQVSSCDDKSSALAYDQVGYSGIHFEVYLKSTDSAASSLETLDGLPCEVQLLTRAQSLWADVSHELAYKPSQESPDETKRLVYLQSALMEIFDNQTAEMRRMIMTAPEFQENRMLDELSKHFRRFTAKDFDRQLSLMILERVKVMFSGNDLDRFGVLLETFVECRISTIQDVFDQYGNDSRRSFLLFQPESLLLYMCMRRDRFILKEIWAQFMALEYLQELADVWGEDIGVIE